MDRKLRTCVVCNTIYRYCNKCKEDEKKPLWYFSFCSPQCHDIYEVTSSFEDGRVTALEAQKILENLDLLKVNESTSYKDSIKKIMSVVPTVETNNEDEQIEKKTRKRKIKDFE